MNKTVNINLAGIFFHIDEDAYLKLQRYLEAIKRSFTDSQGREEIISDIEARISELFTERMKTERQVIGNKEVEEVIAIMGQPEDYLVDDEIFEDEPSSKTKNTYRSSSSKKLYRDTDNSYIGGVSAGLAHYFGIDAIWIRLIWILLVFGAGTGVFLYILLWILVPEAKTTAEKLTMTGEAVNISNIEKKIRDGFDSVSENVKNIDFQKHADKLKEGFEHASDNISDSVKRIPTNKIKDSSKSFFDGLGNLIKGVFKIFAKIIGLFIVLATIAGTVALTVGLIIGSFFNSNIHFFDNDLMELSTTSGMSFELLSILIFIVSVIPLIFLFYLGLKILVSNLKPLSNIAKFTLLGLWLLSLIGLIAISINQGLSYSEKAPVIINEKIETIKSTDTLVLTMKGNDNFAGDYYRRYHNFRTGFDENGEKVTFSQDIRVNIKSTSDSVAKIKVFKSSRGRTFESAKERAKTIDYNYSINGNKLELDNYFLIPNAEAKRDQKVEVTVYLPEGSVIYNNPNTESFISYSSFDGYLRENTGHYFKIKQNNATCLDCPEEEEEDEDEDELKINVDLDGETSKIKFNEDGFEAKGENLKIKINDTVFDASTKNVKVIIDDKEGINITNTKKEK
ncbi:PspC domain-containing protein [Mesoflavibacter sp. SCSIO 43206]|uniref:PspC domain-containing protein n=1 Tax=Mesoflavibacter sp. SCSIO 43206 TaxID=2779362 RepID=UPI001CA8666B|nr:PspC domain-containing protein [Mesoflavibacter sp. SCSIO 43206]UAB75694.1 PspC domain-containing protein [Mesoflavibacter sp. SCSIO 43206]